MQFLTSRKFIVIKKRNFSLVIEPPSKYLDKTRHVPNHISKPHYAQNKEDESTGFLASLLHTSGGIKNRANGMVKSVDMVAKIKEACQVGRRVLNTVKLAVKVFLSNKHLFKSMKVRMELI